MTTTTTGSTDTSSYPAPAVSLARMFYDRVAATPRAEAFLFPAGTGWASLTWAQTAETVKTMAAGLLALGIQPEERGTRAHPQYKKRGEGHCRQDTELNAGVFGAK